MATKKELDAEIVQLKDRIRELESQISKPVEVKEEKLIFPAMGVYRKSGQFYIVKIAYDPSSKAAKVLSEQGMTNTFYRINYEAKKFLVEEILRNFKEVK